MPSIIAFLLPDEALHPTRQRSAARRDALLEVVLTLIVAFVLRLAATPPVARGGAADLGVRFPPAHTDWPALAAVPADGAARAAWLAVAAPDWLPAVAILGLPMLWLARRAQRWGLPWLLVLWAAMALACGVPPAGQTALHEAFGWTPRVIAAIWLFAAGLSGTVLAGLASWLAARSPTPPAAAGRAAPTSRWQALLWPLWCLLLGLTWLVMADFAAGADPQARFFALRHAEACWLANGIALLVAYARRAIGRAWLRGVSRLSALAIDPRQRLRLLGAGLALALLVGWLGRSGRSATLPGLAMPHLSGEALRIGVCLMLAWLLYRGGECAASPARRARLWRALFWVGGLATLGLAVSADAGPLLVLLLAGSLLLGVLAIRRLAGGRSGVALLLAGVLAVSAVAVWRGTLVDLLPQVSALARQREVARATPQLAAHDDQMRVLWLIQATPAGGFGAGRTPWCGAPAQVGEAACASGRGSRVQGAPLQLVEDFAFAVHLARYGRAAAVALVGLALVWWFAVVMSALPRRLPPAGAPAALAMQRAALFWLLTAAAIVALAQTLLSVGGTLAWTPMSGVNLPLLSYGKVSLCSAAVCCGLALAEN